MAETDERVGRAQAVLLGVAVTLAQAPHRLRRPEAADAVARWRAEPVPTSASALPTSSSSRAGGVPAGRVVDPAARLGDGAPYTEASRSIRPPPLSPPVREGDSESAAPPAETTPPPGPEAAVSPPTASEPTPASAPTRSDTEADRWPDGIGTRLGGAFFLLPLMRALGWPEDEEAAWRLASTTGTWGTLDALARALLRDRLDAHTADPLWRLLADLDGRDPDAPPRDAVAPAGADLSASMPGLPPALGAWARSVRPEVEARLVDALALDAPAAIPEAVLLRDATVHATRSHVDVVFPLASASLAVRRAGLDADPGWVPSAGRVVLFHYR